jgi:hypothetical protein
VEVPRDPGEVVTVETLTAVRIELGGCPYSSCLDFAAPLFLQLSRGYETCSVLRVPDTLDEWREAHRTARKRAGRASRLGYQFREIAREEYGHDIFLVNTSLEERQGRPMSNGYREEQTFLPLPEYHCARHAIRTYGVLSDRGTLVAYLWLYRAGELALVSSILGHGEHLDDGIMHLLVQGVVGAEIPHGGFLVYNRHDSGQDGLRQFKSWFGFERTEVEWAL